MIWRFFAKTCWETWYDEKLPDYANVRRVGKFWHKKIFHCNHAEWVNYDDLKIDVSARLHYVGHYGDCIVQWAHGWTRILGENIILSFVLLYSVGIISGVRMSVKTLGNSGGLLVWHYTHLAKTLRSTSVKMVGNDPNSQLPIRPWLSPMKLDPDQERR